MGCRRSRGICSGKGEFDEFFRLHQRGGKSAGVNLAIGAARGEIVVIADIDTTFDRDARSDHAGIFRRSYRRCGEREISASGTRPPTSLRVGKPSSTPSASRWEGVSRTRSGILTIVSGAFGAFRRDALESIGRQDVEVGEDADLTDEASPRGMAHSFRSRCSRAHRCSRHGFSADRTAAALGPWLDHHLEPEVRRSARSAPIVISPDGCNRVDGRCRVSSCVGAGIPGLHRVADILFR